MSSTDTTTGPPRRTTIEDVAAAAGVSVATVSRALRDLPNVAESTRARVRATAEALCYRPDPAASRLAAGRTGTITVAVPTISSWYFSTVVAGAEAACVEAGLEFQVIGVPNDEARDRLLDENRQLERRTDGLILVDIRVRPDQVASLERRNLGLATVGTSVNGHPSVCVDDVLVGEMAAEHLLGLGHERLAAIGGPTEDPMDFDVPKERRRGFERALTAAGQRLDDDLVVVGDFGITGGYAAMQVLLGREQPPTGVFAMSDEMAFGALLAMKERGLRPGHDVSIIGVDDHEFACVVELTTIGQPVVDHGARATQMLLASMNDGSKEVSSYDEVHRPSLDLIVRATTGPPRGSRPPRD